MLILPLQWEKHSGPDSVGQHKLVFTMDESVNHGEFNPMTIRKGTQFLVTLVEANSSELDSFASETEKETTERFRKQFYAIITEIARLKGSTTEIEKEKIKDQLKLEGLIKESTKEMDLNTLAAIIIRLKKYKNGLDQS